MRAHPDPNSTGQGAAQAGFSLSDKQRGQHQKQASSLPLPHRRHLTFTMLSVSLAQPVEGWRRELPPPSSSSVSPSPLTFCGGLAEGGEVGEEGRLAMALQSASPGNSARPLSVGGQSSQAPPPQMEPGCLLVDYFITFSGAFLQLFQELTLTKKCHKPLLKNFPLSCTPRRTLSATAWIRWRAPALL